MPFVRTVSTLSVISISVTLALASSTHAQITSVFDPTSTPVPGVGHDYIKLLSETVAASARRLFMSRALFTILILVPTLLFMPPLSNGQSQGIPWYTVPLPLPNGLVDAVSGNVHLEIPLGSMPQRNGDPIISKMVYDTAYFTPLVISGTAYWNGYGVGWGPVVGSSRGPGGGTFDSSVQSCPQAGFSDYPNGQVTFWSHFRTTDINRTTHSLDTGQPGPPATGNLSTMQVNCRDQYGNAYGSSSDVTYINNGSSSDGSGYTFQVTNYNQLIIHAADGTLITDTTSDGLSNDPMPVDTNGNTRSSAPNLSSGLPGYSGCTSSVTTSSGASASYTCTNTNLSVSSVVNGTTYVGTESFLTSIALPDGTSYSFTYDTGTTGNHYGTITGITLSSGGTVSFTYTLTGTGWPSPMKAQTVSYGGGTWNLNYVQSNCSSTCTSTTTVTAPPRYNSASGTNINDNSVFTSTVSPLEFLLQTAQYYSGSSTLLRTVTFTPDNMLPTTVTTTLNDTGQSFSVYYQYYAGLRDHPTLKQETDFSGNIIRTTKTTYGIYAKPTSVNVYTGDGSSGSPIASTLYTYDEYGASYCKNSVPMLASFTGAYGHDDGNFGTLNTARGNVTTIQRLISGTTYATTHMCYDTLGNVTQTVDANGNPTSYDYSENWADAYCIPSGTVTHAFPTTITDALGHQSKTSYYSCGILKHSVQDPNDLAANRNGTVYTYDELNRPLTTTYPDTGSTTMGYPSPTLVTTTRAMGSGNMQTAAVLDGYGRTIQTQLNSDPDCSSGDKTDTTYDGLGRLQSVSNPYCTTSDPTYGLTAYAHDALARTTQVTQPDGSVITTSYSGSTTTVTDEAGKKRQSQTDGLGRLTQVVEDPGGLGYVTTYSYDGLSNLTGVVQNGSRQRTFAYDSLSRLTSATNPESGTINYTYDANGNLATKTAPAPNQTGSATVTTTYSYDALNRMTLKSYSDGTTPYAQYTWDGSPYPGPIPNVNDIGRLAATWSPNYTGSKYDYDPMGRVANSLDCIDVNCNWNSDLSYTYDLLGDLTAYTNKIAYWTNPPVSSITFNQSFDSAGRVTQLTSSWVDAQHPATLVTTDSSIGYFPHGALRKASLGNGLTLTNVFNNRLQPCLIDVNQSNATLQTCNDPTPSANVIDFWMAYDAGTADNGNVTHWNASSGPQRFVRTYTYDSLNRLATMADSGAGESCLGLSWSYDAWGNRTAQTVTGGSCYQQPSTTFSAKNQLPPPYQYDAAGNMTNDGTHSYTYDAENRLIQVDGGATANYAYDPTGRRAQKTIGGTTTSYTYDQAGNTFLETQGTTWETFYLYFAGRLQAQYKNSTTYFIHADHLGSTHMVTDINAHGVDSMDYLPFGEQISGGTATTHKFTGKERDSESGNDNFEARYNSSSIGRFMSHDPHNAGAKLENPQTWSAYSYTANNPLNFVDPSGLDSCAAARGGYFPGVLELPDQACPQPSPTTPPQPQLPQKKLKITRDSPYDPINSGTIDNAGGQIDLAATKQEGPAGRNYHGITAFDALDCATRNDPSDSGCWGVGVKLTANGYQATWSSDAYASARDNYVLWSWAFKFGGITGKLGPFLLNGTPKDPLEPIKLAEPTFPTTVASPTAQTYSCQGFQLWIHANPSALLGRQAATYGLNCH